MKLYFSKRRHIPIIRLTDGEHYFWDLIGAIKFLRHYYLHYRKYTFSQGRARIITTETPVWKKHYLPKMPLNKEALILDAGAGEGETILFYARHGFKNFRAVEIDTKCCEILKQNIENDHRLDVEIRNSPFSLEDLNDVDFAKIDVEGAERQLLSLEKIQHEMVVEVHGSGLLKECERKWPHIEPMWSAKCEAPLAFEEVYLIRLYPMI
jgi:2-polyprenyl-3-methyl-5-hydroxy-6-metoxy-1,4-benzoquinol methylase